MDGYEAAMVIHDRIKELEPDCAKKIIGYMVLQEIPEEEMIRLAFGPDNFILNFIQKLITTAAVYIPSDYTPPFSSSTFTSPPPPPPHFSASFQSLATSNNRLQNQLNSGYLEEADTTKFGFPNNNNYGQRVKICHYFIKGTCKHGINCRYFHGETTFAGGLYSEDQVFHPGCLEKLELEVVELLKSQRGNPISIAYLPTMYYERYGRSLQADGYLSESQRHGRQLGCTLTNLLARLNRVRRIHRPHGQHAVVLAEDALKYNMDIIQGERPIVSASKQIYLTFPSETTFSEEHVSDYFNWFGTVEDVRIPWQEKRMFGFVTFESANTVKLVLSTGNPHYVCGARVLVKPYREKSKMLAQRSSMTSSFKKFDSVVYYHPRPLYIDSKLLPRTGSYKLLDREHENAVEQEMRHLSQLQLAPKNLTAQFYSDYANFPFQEHYMFNHLDVMNPVNNCSDQESDQGLSLPDNPFAFESSISISATV